MAIDVKALLSPISDADPTGANLSDDASLELSVQRDRIAYGLKACLPDAKKGRSEPLPPRGIIELCGKCLGVQKDIWFGVYMAQAGASAGDLDAVAAGAEIVAGLLADMWDQASPPLSDGIVARSNASDTLGSYADFVRRLAAAPLWKSRQGAFTAGDITAGAGERYDLFISALSLQGPADLQAIAGQIARFQKALDSIDAAFEAYALSAGVFDDAAGFGTSREFMERLLSHIGEAIEAPRSAPADGPAAEIPAASPQTTAAPSGFAASAPAAPAGTPIRGRIASREDVARAIDEICAYYKAQEPGSPIPMVLERVKTWLPMSFIDVLKEIAPGSVSEAERILVRQNN
ncbi:ImpA family type VI secretion system protein [Caulobacter flavus]|uniref:type VI secretion system protein TssA n=1 Tax=Caulobacter flavus TaxID=1679497 RepID=UPI0013DDB91B|nr:type VI secretion system ImpA family N-terminal domain-containing protein [Caulobacter flavus]